MSRFLSLSLLLVLCAGCPIHDMPSDVPNVPLDAPLDADAQTVDTPDVIATDGPIGSTLPTLPEMLNVQTTVRGDSVDITFEPVDDARDYRVYALPNNVDVMPGANGALTVRNALYRCAGDRQTRRVSQDSQPLQQSEGIRTIVEGTVQGVARSLATATLGYVFVTPGDGRIPVYAMGDPSERGDNSCYHQRWNETRVKRYVSSETERQQLLDQHWRDDGIAFYVPAVANVSTLNVQTALVNNAHRVYFAQGVETRTGATTAWPVLRSPPGNTGAEVQPLMRVHYENGCGNSHDELVAGRARFQQARVQSDQNPLRALHWSGLTRETVLVVEALDQGCPFRGLVAPAAAPAYRSNASLDYQRWFTIDELRAANPTGEVWINAQHEATNTPKPIARSFVRVSPGALAPADWSLRFGPGETFGPFQSINCGVPGGNCWQQFRSRSTNIDLGFLYTETERKAASVMLGELWAGYADVGADVGAKVRITPDQRATLSANQFLYVTMEVDAFTTGRRYPQIIISDQSAPIEYNYENGNTLLFETFSDPGTSNWPALYQMEVCNHRAWDVNNHCPTYGQFHRREGSTEWSPIAEVSELAGVDRTTFFEVYVSTTKSYMFVNGRPHGCIVMPSAGVPSGSVSVTFGDVLYHSGVDEVFHFHEQHMKIEQIRHFDNLSFRSGVPAPTWDESRLPCRTRVD